MNAATWEKKTHTICAAGWVRQECLRVLGADILLMPCYHCDPPNLLRPVRLVHQRAKLPRAIAPGRRRLAWSPLNAYPQAGCSPLFARLLTSSCASIWRSPSLKSIARSCIVLTISIKLRRVISVQLSFIAYLQHTKNPDASAIQCSSSFSNSKNFAPYHFRVM